MKNSRDDSFFSRLIAPLLDQLDRIARGSRAEQSVDDLKNEAWLAAHEIRAEHGIDFEPEDESFQQAILSRLRKAFGKFVNRKMRFAVQLDHEQPGNDGDFLPNSVAASLAASDIYEPEIALARVEEHDERERYLTGRFAEAVAYLRSLEHFNGDCGALAAHLAITVGALTSRLGRAETVAHGQSSIFDGIEAVPVHFVPLRGSHSRGAIRHPNAWTSICPQTKRRQLRLFSSAFALFGRR